MLCCWVYSSWHLKGSRASSSTASLYRWRCYDPSSQWHSNASQKNWICSNTTAMPQISLCLFSFRYSTIWHFHVQPFALQSPKCLPPDTTNKSVPNLFLYLLWAILESCYNNKHKHSSVASYKMAALPAPLTGTFPMICALCYSACLYCTLQPIQIILS